MIQCSCSELTPFSKALMANPVSGAFLLTRLKLLNKTPACSYVPVSERINNPMQNTLQMELFERRINPELLFKLSGLN